MAYKPNVQNNLKLREDLANNFNYIKRRVEKGKVNKSLDYAAVSSLLTEIENAIGRLDDNALTGTENLAVVHDKAIADIKALDKQLNDEYMTQIKTTAEDLLYVLDQWKDLIDDPNAIIDINGGEEVSRKRQALEIQLGNLVDIKDNLMRVKNKKESDIQLEEAKAKELEDKMVEETNERKITDYYNAYNSEKLKIDNMGVYSSHLFNCATVLDRVIENIRYILETSGDNTEAFGRAKAYLNMDKIKNIAEDPAAALAVLKNIDSHIEELKKKIPTFAAPTKESSAATQSALDFRAKLMAERAAKEAAKSAKETDLNSLEQGKPVNAASGVKTTK